MGKVLLVTLVAISVGLAVACHPDNEPPNAPAFRILEFTSESITGTFGNNCIDPDDKPVGKCQQWVRIGDVDRNKVVGTYKATDGIVTVSGLRPAGNYVVSPYHTDTDAATGGEVIPWTTAGTSGPQIIGIGPTEIVAPAEVVVHGLGLSGAEAIYLVEPNTGVKYQGSVLFSEGNRVTVVVPRPSGLTKRKPYFLTVGTNNKVSVNADKVWVSPSDSYLPLDGQRIQIRVVRWMPSASCGALLCGSCKAIDGWRPIVRDALAGISGKSQGTDDWWADTWGSPEFAPFAIHASDTGREWKAMCSETWGSGYPIGGITLQADPVVLPSSNLYWLNTTSSSIDIASAAKRQRTDGVGTWDSSSIYDFCTETSDRKLPSHCSRWKKNANGFINVHLVGAFLFGSTHLSPLELRGISEPPSTGASASETKGQIFLSDEPFFEARLKTKKPPGQLDECIAHYYKAGDPVGATYWWGPQAGRNVEQIPNVFSHELHHVLTRYVHDASGAPDPCWSPAVGQPTSTCGRGFDMDLGPGLDAHTMCGRAVNGADGRDYTN
jgi:hypothetical protein